MVAITATSSATPMLQAAVLRGKLEQAQREADRADAQAKDLQSQADEAERQAGEERGVVSDLSAQARQLQAVTYSKAPATSEAPAKSEAPATSEAPASSGLPAQRQNFLAQASTYFKAASTSEVPTETQDFLIRLYTATSDKFASNGNALKSSSDAAPVVNAQGQATGRILNLRA